MARAPIRPARVASMLREVVANALAFDVRDPRVAGVIVTDVEVSGDLQEARVFFHIEGDASRVASATEGLGQVAGFLRRAVGERISLRHTPRLTFRHDASLEYAARIEARLVELGLGVAAAAQAEGVDNDASEEESPAEASIEEDLDPFS